MMSEFDAENHHAECIDAMTEPLDIAPIEERLKRDSLNIRYGSIIGPNSATYFDFTSALLDEVLRLRGEVKSLEKMLRIYDLQKSTPVRDLEDLMP